MIRFKYNWGWLTLLLIFCFLSFRYINSNLLQNADWFHYNRRFGKADNYFNKAEAMYLKVIREEIKDQKDLQRRIDAMIQLGHMYREGIPDRYDSFGEKIKGIKPNLKKAIQTYKKIYDTYKLPQPLLWIGDIYHYDYENLIKAEQIYHELENNEKAYKLRGQISDRLRQIREKRTPMLRFGFSDRPYQLHTSIMDPLLMPQIRLPDMRNQSNYNLDLANINTRNTRNTRNNNNNRNRNRNNGRGNNVHEPPDINRVRVEDPRRIINDPQNVHDSTLLQSIRNSISKLQNSTRITMNTPISLKMIRDYILGNSEGDKRNDAIRTLDRIETVTDPNNFEITESDTLSLVWNRINNEYPDGEYKNALRGNVINELAESVEHDKVVCGIGRRSHILGVLDGSDKDVALRPKWALSHEMMNKASLIRKNMINNLTTVQRNAINTYDEEKITSEQKIIQNKFDQDLKNEIKQQLTRDYVDSGVMTNDSLNTELSKWIDDI